MIQLVNKPSYHYDADYDALTLFIGASNDYYSDEICNNVYIVRNEIDDSIIAIEILYFKRRSITNLRNFVPTEYYDILLDIKRTI
jgi:hypothetical protein